VIKVTENGLNLIWPDGSIVTGATFRELEDALRASQWHTFETRREFRHELRRRAAIYSGKPMEKVRRQSSKQFIFSLVHSGVCMLEDARLPNPPKK
jgi:hypothetical protein